MRETVDSRRVREFLSALGRELRTPCTVYVTGGASAVLEGWRETTIDVDAKFVPEDEVFAVIPRLKEQLRINVELASPDLFPPPLPDWESRSPVIERFGSVEARHFDFYSQALSKLERGFARDVDDVRAMVRRGLVEVGRLIELARAILPRLDRYPAVSPEWFIRAVEAFAASPESGEGDAPDGGVE